MDTYLKFTGAIEIILYLRVFALLPEDLSLFPTTYNPASKEPDVLFCTPQTTTLTRANT